MSLVSFLNNLFKHDGFELIDANSDHLQIVLKLLEQTGAEIKIVGGNIILYSSVFCGRNKKKTLGVFFFFLRVCL